MSLPSGIDLNNECQCPSYLEDGLKHARKATSVTQKQAEIILSSLIVALEVDCGYLGDYLQNNYEEFENWDFKDLESTLSAMDLRFGDEGARGNFIGFLTND